MLLFLYNFTWTLFVFLSLPLLLSPKGRRFRERICTQLPADPPAQKTLWVHALSVGEVISAQPLLQALKRRFPRKEIVLTVTTVQGMEIARQLVQDDVRCILPMPLDFWWSVNRTLRFINPSLFLLVETDLWPGLLYSLRKRRIDSMMVNGRISPRTHMSYKKFRLLVRPLLNTLGIIMVQTDIDRQRLLDVGIQREKVRTSGNIKFDRHWHPLDSHEFGYWMEVLGLEPEQILWVAGSTHPGEESTVLSVFKNLKDAFPDLRLLIAPRRVERCEEICRKSSEMGFNTTLRTRLSPPKGGYEVIILDTIGELGRIYGLAKISFVGGSLTPVGGHNILEPARFGHPVLFGPHMHNFEHMSQLMIEAGGGVCVANALELSRVLTDLLKHPERAAVIGQKARAFVETHQGALDRILDHVETRVSL